MTTDSIFQDTLDKIIKPDSWEAKLPPAYHPHDFLVSAPVNAPDWVKKVWEPMHKESMHPDPACEMLVIQCNKNNEIPFIGLGPMEGIKHCSPNPSATIYYKVADGGIHTYELRKEGYTVGNRAYVRMVYVLIPKDQEKESSLPPFKDGIDWNKHLDTYKKSNPSPYQKYTYPSHSYGTHSMDWDIKDINPDALATLFGKKPQEEEVDPPALWE